jgi:hypothetical protein
VVNLLQSVLDISRGETRTEIGSVGGELRIKQCWGKDIKTAALVRGV